MKDLIIVRGGGDLATGAIYKLKTCGFPVLILETPIPSAIRRNAAFCEAGFVDFVNTDVLIDVKCRRICHIYSR